MAMLREQIAQRTKGPLGENEDWWVLCYNTGVGRFHVQHEWSYINPYKLPNGGSTGTTRHDAASYTGQGSDRLEEAKRLLLERADI